MKRVPACPLSIASGQNKRSYKYVCVVNFDGNSTAVEFHVYNRAFFTRDNYAPRVGVRGT